MNSHSMIHRMSKMLTKIMQDKRTPPTTKQHIEWLFSSEGSTYTQRLLTEGPEHGKQSHTIPTGTGAPVCCRSAETETSARAMPLLAVFPPRRILLALPSLQTRPA